MGLDRRAKGRNRAAARRRARTGGGRVRRVPLLLVLVGLIGGGAYWAHRAGVLDRHTLQQLSLPGLRPPASREATLFFADPRWTRLVPETREIPAAGGAVGAMEAVVAALADGSREGHAPVLPGSVRLKGAYVGSDGLAVLDFPGTLAQFSPGGASGEALAVFAVVNSIAGSVPGIERVWILIEGEERETLAGHVKISEPLAPDRQWLEPPPQ